jgi:hypothetical protein
MKDPCNRFLKKDGFVILACNREDPSKHGPFEAWAYRGPLDLAVATPVTFGVGICVADALSALKHQLKGARQCTSPAGNGHQLACGCPRVQSPSPAIGGETHAEEE